MPLLHSDGDTLERVAVLRDLRAGVYDVLIGINLLREGLDLPEVSLLESSTPTRRLSALAALLIRPSDAQRAT